jgi:LemA protein
LVEARQNYNSAKSIGEKINASKAVTASLGNLIAIGEGYPELKSSAQFAHLQSRVSELENSIADRRELLNEAATNFNTRIEQVPDMIFAQVLNYRTLPLYKITAQEVEQPNLKMKLSV